MTTGRHGSALEHVQRLFGGGTVAGSAEGQLLERFVARRDEVGVRGARGPARADGPGRLPARAAPTRTTSRTPSRPPSSSWPARPASLRDARPLGPWLHGVARRVAVRRRADAARRRGPRAAGRSSRAAERRRPTPDRRDLRAVLDEEIARLPEKYRAPIVLCYLEGLTHEEAAARLRWPVGTVRSRLARAPRPAPRGPAARRGLAPSGGRRSPCRCRPRRQSTVSTAVHVLMKQGAAGVVSAGAITLAEGVSTTMFANKLKLIAVALFTAGLVSAGTGGLARQADEGRPAPGAARTAEPQPPGSGVGEPTGASSTPPGDPGASWSGPTR